MFSSVICFLFILLSQLNDSDCPLKFCHVHCKQSLDILQLSINGDKEFLDDVQKVNPYHLTPVIAVALGQPDESKEAGPLPVKVDLNKTSI